MMVFVHIILLLLALGLVGFCVIGIADYFDLDKLENTAIVVELIIGCVVVLTIAAAVVWAVFADVASVE